MKVKAKKRVVSRKKQASENNYKPVSTKKKPVGVKGGKSVGDSKKRVKSRGIPVKRDKNGHILPGSGSNGGGRPKGSFSGMRTSELNQSISRVEIERRKPAKKRKIIGWLDHQVNKSYEDTSLAIAILARKYPILKAIEQVTFDGDLLSREELEDAQAEYSKRFED